MDFPATTAIVFLALDSTLNATAAASSRDHSFLGLTVRQLRYVFATLCSLILLVGLTGNLLMLLVLIEGLQSSSSSSSSHISTLTSTLMVNITVSDLLFLLYNVTVLLLAFLQEDWQMGVAVCVSSQSLSMWTMFCSFYSMVATSILRYVAVVHPTCSFSTSKVQRLLLCTSMWLLGFFVSIPNWLHQRVMAAGDAHYCVLLLTPEQTFLYFLLFGGIAFLPFVLLMLLCYSRVVQSLWFRSTRVGHLPGSAQLNQKATVMILTVVTVFVLMWIPCSVVIYLSATHRLSQTPAAFVASSLAMVLAYSNCSVSPLICFSLSAQFQGSLKKLLFRRGPR
ncbi:C-C chemokine receptor type 1-like [Chelydra serpentina]|uniref:C-C chemokine receptor type 1-like n=1 Tax=Chelydra serpentina TaxID=8475 RepID=A0A8T1RZV3_CHESE|nr:C-C chemokine receptor type 1-like [Chelydra serpentina]